MILQSHVNMYSLYGNVTSLNSSKKKKKYNKNVYFLCITVVLQAWGFRPFNKYYLLTESEVITGKSQTALMY